MVEESFDVLRPGDVAPDFELKGADGDVHGLSDFVEYRAILVVFTCNHCPYAQSKLPHLNALADEYTDVAVVGINPNENPDYPDDSYERMVELVEDGTVDYDAYLLDSTQQVAADYGAVCTPDPFLFSNGGGTFRLAYHGRVDDATSPEDDPDREEMREAIEAVLAGETVPVTPQPSRGCSIKWREGNQPDYWDEI